MAMKSNGRSTLDEEPRDILVFSRKHSHKEVILVSYLFLFARKCAQTFGDSLALK